MTFPKLDGDPTGLAMAALLASDARARALIEHRAHSVDEAAITLAAFHVFANERLGEIAGRLTRGAKLTLVIRLVDDPDSEIVISNDTEADAIAALERAKARGGR